MRPLIAYVVTAVIFAGMDFLWLSNTQNTLYRPAIGELLADKVRLGPAIAFYVIYIFGLVWFAVLPGLETGRWSKTLVNAAIFGAVAYATYDLTCQATMKVWSTQVTLADLAWGVVASSVASTLAMLITRAVTK